MTRPAFRDVTYVGTLAIYGIVLAVNLWAWWVRPDAPTSIVVVVVCAAITMNVRLRHYVDAVRATQHAEQQKFETEKQVAEEMLAHIRKASAMTWHVDAPLAERRH